MFLLPISSSLSLPLSPPISLYHSHSISIFYLWRIALVSLQYWLVNTYWLPLCWVRFEPMTLGCEAAALTTRPLRHSHSHTLKLSYLCQSVSICYLVLPSFRFWRNYIILHSNINITYCCLFVVTVLLVQWLAMLLHTQESQVRISLIHSSTFNYIIFLLVFYTIFFAFLHTYCYILNYALLYNIILLNTIQYHIIILDSIHLYCTTST